MFIWVTNDTGKLVLVNVQQIVCVDPEGDAQSVIHFTDGKGMRVLETPAEIRARIKEEQENL